MKSTVGDGSRYARPWQGRRESSNHRQRRTPLAWTFLRQSVWNWVAVNSDALLSLAPSSLHANPETGRRCGLAANRNLGQQALRWRAKKVLEKRAKKEIRMVVFITDGLSGPI